MALHAACAAHADLMPALRAAHACMAIAGAGGEGFGGDCVRVASWAPPTGPAAEGVAAGVVASIMRQHGADPRVAAACGPLVGSAAPRPPEALCAVALLLLFGFVWLYVSAARDVETTEDARESKTVGLTRAEALLHVSAEPRRRCGAASRLGRRSRRPPAPCSCCV